jgi:hypothetical protein
MTEHATPIASAADVPATWGAPRAALRKSTVARRAPVGVETFTLDWGTLTAQPDEDWIVIQETGEEYPVKRDIFARTYEEVAPGRFRKKARSRLVQVPAGVTAILATREGELAVRHPDYVAIGAEGEVYANAAEWVAANLEFVA